MKRAFGNGVDRDSLPSIDQLTSGRIDSLHCYRLFRADGQCALASSPTSKSTLLARCPTPPRRLPTQQCATKCTHSSATTAQRFVQRVMPVPDHSNEACEAYAFANVAAVRRSNSSLLKPLNVVPKLIHAQPSASGFASTRRQ